MSDFIIRPLEGEAELRACVELQEETWGPGFDERAPATILRIAQRVGGIASGAFDGDGRLAGFVFGITGVEDGRLVHWSDMLAIRPDLRDRGLGEALKRHQRDELLKVGVEEVLWTFDPLEARNARLNLSRLGAISREYLRDYYGEGLSPLHAGIGTDRLLVRWRIGSDRVRRRLAGRTEPPTQVACADAERVLDVSIGPTFPSPNGEMGRPCAPIVTIAVPSDIQRMKTQDLALAQEWRRAVRAAFEACFAAGYEAVELVREDDRVARYVLEAATA